MPVPGFSFVGFCFRFSFIWFLTGVLLSFLLLIIIVHLPSKLRDTFTKDIIPARYDNMMFTIKLTLLSLAYSSLVSPLFFLKSKDAMVWLTNGICWEMVYVERWYLLRDGICWEMVFVDRWYLLRDGWQMVRLT